MLKIMQIKNYKYARHICPMKGLKERKVDFSLSTLKGVPY